MDTTTATVTPTTGTTAQDRDHLIDLSIAEDRIAHAAHTDALAAMLEQECEGSITDGDGPEEYWGEDLDGNTWRVHLHR